MPRSEKAGVVATLCLVLWPAWASMAQGEHLSCPDRPEVECVPGKLAGRVVCARDTEILEYESVTAFCEACHAGRGDQDGATRKMSWGHSLEIEYPAGRKGFTAPADLYGAIRLTEGRVTCESCHGGASKENHYLSVHARQSNLCTHCHQK